MALSSSARVSLDQTQERRTRLVDEIGWQMISDQENNSWGE